MDIPGSDHAGAGQHAVICCWCHGRVFGKTLYRNQRPTFVYYSRDSLISGQGDQNGAQQGDIELSDNINPDKDQRVRAEFDLLADEYHDQHKENVAITGENPEFFSEYKIADLAALVADQKTALGLCF